MKKYIIHFPSFQLRLLLLILVATVITGTELNAQDSTAAAPVAKKKSYVKNTFEGNFLIDNQTVMVPIKGTFEFDISHRFGTINNQFKDLFGLFSSANMRLGFSYTPIKDLQVGFGANNYNMIVDWSLKYAVVKQTKDGRTGVKSKRPGAIYRNERSCIVYPFRSQGTNIEDGTKIKRLFETSF